MILQPKEWGYHINWDIDFQSREQNVKKGGKHDLMLG